MSFVKLRDSTGFDEQQDLLVLSLGQTTNLYLPNFGTQPVTVRSADAGIASVVGNTTLTDKQKTAVMPPGVVRDPFKAPQPPEAAGVSPGPVISWFGMNRIQVRGESLGTTQLIAESGGQSWQNPTQVVVVSNLNSRQADRGPVGAAFALEIQRLSLRAAAVRLAQDQLNSTFAQDTKGDGRYGLPELPSTDWCGAFVYWCYKKACEIRGDTNPLGPINDVVLSPQKAIGWAIHNPNAATLLRYKGPALFTWLRGEKQQPTQDTFIDVNQGVNLMKGDVCLVRNDTNWQHVCMVYDPGETDRFRTADGNQGTPSMKLVDRYLTERIASGQFKYVFVHLNLPA